MPPPVKDPVLLQHDASKAQYTKIAEGVGHLESLREELDKLTALGDMVDQNDVVKAASNLVGKGFSAHEMAVLLSQMPDNAEALRGWITQQDQMVRTWEANAEGHLAAARHQLGIDALHVLMHDHLGGAQAQAQGATSQPQPQMGMTSPQSPVPQGMALNPGSPTVGSA